MQNAQKQDADLKQAYSKPNPELNDDDDDTFNVLIISKDIN